MSVALDESYRLCRRVARRAARNFYYAFWVLPPVKRRSMCALYAFYRRTDDLGDDEAPLEARRRSLAEWRTSFRAALAGRFHDPLLPAVVDTVRRYAIPPEYLETAIDGVESDLDRAVFATFEELETYCYQVASVVGLACIHVWGFRPDPAAFEAARQCGVAFQLTNILRDVAEDARRGRIYLPQDELRRFGVADEQIRRGVVDDAWRALIRFQIERAEGYYAAARSLTAYLDPDGVGIYGAMVDIYHGLLTKIGRRDGDLFRRRVRLSPWHKAAIAWRYLRPRWSRLRYDAAPLRAEARSGAG